MRTWSLWTALLVVGCGDVLLLPDAPPAPGPGSLSGVALVSVPGTPLPVPAAGVRVSIARAGLSVTTGEDGRFLLAPITTKGGQLTLQLDRDGDGHAELARTVDLSRTASGPDRDVTLGDLVLGRNASIRGRVLRAGHENERTGHAGTTVLAAETPYLTLTGDDGTFVLAELPAGPLTLSAWRDGFEATSLTGLELRPGETLLLDDLVLAAATTGGTTGTVRVRVDATPASDLTRVRLRAVGSDSGEIPVDSGGNATATLAAGTWTLAADLDGYGTAFAPNVLVTPGTSTDAGTLHLAAGAPVLTLDPVDPQDPPDTPTLAAPTARIDAAEIAATGATLTLDATQSRAALAPAGAFLSFSWSADGLTFTPNDSALAGRTRTTLPGTKTRIVVTLVVTDTRTGLTDSATHTVEVVEPPVARLTPGRRMALASAEVSFDGSASTDPLGAPLQFFWSGDAAIARGGDTSAVTFFAPDTPGTYRVTLVVSNGLVESTPASGEIEVVAATQPPTVDAGPDRIVNTDETVSLVAEVASATVVRTEWRQLVGPAVTLVPDVTGAHFVAPGSFTQLVFSVTATNDAGSTSDEVVVEVRDTTPPRIVSSEPSTGLAASPFFLALTFDEPIDVGALDRILLDGRRDTLDAVHWQADRKRLVLVPARPLETGSSHVVALRGIRDVAPIPNVLPDTEVPIANTRPPRWRTWTGHASDAPFFPGVLPGPAPVRLGHVAKPSGCGGGAFHPELSVTNDDGTLRTIASGDACEGFDWNRLLRTIDTSDGRTWLSYRGAQWVRTTGGFGRANSLGCADTFTDGDVPMLASGDDGGAFLFRFDPASGQFLTWGSRFTGYRGYTTGASLRGGPTVAGSVHTGRSPTELNVVVRGAGDPDWTSLGLATTDLLGDFALGFASQQPVFAASRRRSGASVVTVGHRDTGTWVLREAVNPVPNASGPVELQTRSRFAFVAYAANNLLYAFTFDPLDDASPITPVAGPDADRLTTDDACTVFHVTSAIDDEGLNLAWSESCPSGWKTVVRRWE